MANILTADLPSDDDLDDDFDPAKDDGGSGDEKKRHAVSRKRLRVGGPLGADSGVRDEHEEVSSPVLLLVAQAILLRFTSAVYQQSTFVSSSSACKDRWCAKLLESAAYDRVSHQTAHHATMQ